MLRSWLEYAVRMLHARRDARVAARMLLLLLCGVSYILYFYKYQEPIYFSIGVRSDSEICVNRIEFLNWAFFQESIYHWFMGSQLQGFMYVRGFMRGGMVQAFCVTDP